MTSEQHDEWKYVIKDVKSVSVRDIAAIQSDGWKYYSYMMSEQPDKVILIFQRDPSPRKER